MAENYIIKWNEPSRRWFIRGIQEDGRFYGEVMLRSPEPEQIDIQGQLLPSELQRLRGIVREIAASGQEVSNAPWTGLLASGVASSPRVLFQFREQDEGTPAARLFLELIDILGLRHHTPAGIRTQ